jgi:antitoxin component of MazEF toxin-antitoxin module
MKTKLIKRGNSSYVLLPQVLVGMYEFGTSITIQLRPEGILILATRKPRADWDERFKLALKPTFTLEDELWLNTDDNTNDWTW